jgi:FkbM family methyltransferase
MCAFFSKLQILLNSCKIFKNWYKYPEIYYKLTTNKFPILETKSGLKIKIRKNSTDLMALTHVWLIGEYKRKNFEIKTDDVVIDVGGHIGLFTLYASQFCKTGSIFTFEPVKENFELLSENVSSNNLNHVKSFNLAVSNSSSSVTLYLNEDTAGHSMFSKSSQSITVNSISLKQIFDDNNIDRCDFLKLDCEGSEYEIIKNLPSEYFQKIQKMIIEYHMADTHPELLDELMKILKSQNYKLETKTLFSDIGFLYAIRTNS